MDELGSFRVEIITSSVLVQWYRELLGDGDQDRFIEQIQRHYNEEMLKWVLATGNVESRRAAVLALGWTGTFSCNSSLGEALHDPDLAVRQLAADALWDVWFRAGTPEQNRKLRLVSELVSQALAHRRAGLASEQRQRLQQAIQEATELITEAPDFPEAYNRRAIAYFEIGRYEKAIRDCQKVLKLNPYHFGAASGMAQCYLALGRRNEAAEAFQRATAIKPDLRMNFRWLEQSVEE